MQVLENTRRQWIKKTDKRNWKMLATIQLFLFLSSFISGTRTSICFCSAVIFSLLAHRTQRAKRKGITRKEDAAEGKLPLCENSEIKGRKSTHNVLKMLNISGWQSQSIILLSFFHRTSNNVWISVSQTYCMFHYWFQRCLRWIESICYIEDTKL